MTEQAKPPRGVVRLDLTVYKRALDDPAPAWCEEHALPCGLVQHYALTGRIGDEEIPLMVVRAVGHA